MKRILILAAIAFACGVSEASAACGNGSCGSGCRAAGRVRARLVARPRVKRLFGRCG